MINLVLLAVVFLVSLLAGLLPLHVQISSTAMQVVSELGSGLFLGTALGVLIPEGVAAIQANSAVSDEGSGTGGSEVAGLCLVVGFVAMMAFEQFKPKRVNWIVHPLTFGLAIHSLVDGLLLAAGLVSQQAHLKTAILLSMVFHKIPTTSTLAILLLHAGVPVKQVRLQIVAFSAVAPLSALATGLLVVEKLQSVSGHLMALSAGTFLFVSVVHILPSFPHTEESHSGHEMLPHHSDAHLDRTEKPSSGMHLRQLLLLAVGMFVPLLLSLLHHH